MLSIYFRLVASITFVSFLATGYLFGTNADFLYYCEKGKMEKALDLLEQGDVDINTQDVEEKFTGLMSVCRRGSKLKEKEMMQDFALELLNNPKIDIFRKNIYGKTALDIAEKKGLTRVVARIKELENIKQNEQAVKSVLVEALTRGKEALPKDRVLSPAAAKATQDLLVALKTTTDARKQGILVHSSVSTPLIMGDYLHQGADVFFRDDEGVTLCQIYLTVVSSSEVKKYLAAQIVSEYNSEITRFNKEKGTIYGWNPLFWAAESYLKRFDILNYLIEKGFPLNFTDDNGSTVLHIAVQNDNRDGIEAIAQRIDLSLVKDKQGKIPSDYFGMERD